MAGFSAIIGGSEGNSAKLHALIQTASYRGGAEALQGHNWAFALQQRASNSEHLLVTSERITAILGWPYRIVAGQSVALSAVWLDQQRFDQDTLDQIFGQYILFQLDCQTGELLLQRDALGGYPAHVMAQDNAIYLASDICQLAAVSSSPVTLNRSAVQRLHQFGLLGWQGLSLYSGISLVPPGVIQRFSSAHTLTLSSPDRARLLHHFDADSADHNSAQITSVTALRHSCAQAFAGKPGLCLSGGMDSGLLALIASDLGAKFRAYSAVFPGFQADESQAIERLQRHLGFKTHAIMLSDFRAEEGYERLCALSDYPVFPATFIATSMARLMAADGLTHLIDGNGGDELFEWPLQSLSTCEFSWRNFFKIVGIIVSSIRQRGFSSQDYLSLRHMMKRLLLGRTNKTLQSRLQAAQRMLGSSDESPFYLAAEQQIARLGLEVRSPLRDAYLIQAVLPFMPIAAWCGGQRRALQHKLCLALSNNEINLKREQKVNFNEFALLPGEKTHALLGQARVQNFAGLVPRFLAFKQTQGIKLNE